MRNQQSLSTIRIALAMAVAVGLFSATPAVRAAVTDYQAMIQADASLAYYYNFDGADDATRLADKAGSANLTPSANLPTLGAAGFDASSDAAEFSPATEQRLVSAAGSVTLDGVSITSEIIFRADSVGDAHIFSAKEASGNRTYFALSSFGKADVFATTGGAAWASIPTADYIATGNLVPGNWYFLAATYTISGGDTTIQAYTADLTAGGPLTATAPITTGGVYTTSATEFAIGANWWSDGAIRFDGATDELAIFNGALSEAAIAEHFAAITVPEPSSMVLLGLAIVGLGARRRRRAR